VWQRIIQQTIQPGGAGDTGSDQIGECQRRHSQASNAPCGISFGLLTRNIWNKKASNRGVHESGGKYTIECPKTSLY
jgi:hypothetical protein